MAVDYAMNYSEIAKQSSELNSQLEALNKTLTEMKGVEDSMLTSAKWEAEDKKEFTDRFQAFLDGGHKLHQTGTSQAETLKQVADTYHKAEQH